MFASRTRIVLLLTTKPSASARDVLLRTSVCVLITEGLTPASVI